jgi:hypothetical protein
MQNRNSNSTLFLVLILFFTFPIWIGVVGTIFGIFMGVGGAIIGVFAGVFGALLGAIGGTVGWIFDWNVHDPFSFFASLKLIAITMIIVFFVLVTRSKR